MAQSSSSMSPIPRTNQHVSAMEHCPAAALRSSYTQTLPPRRGQVKLRILKGFVKSATSFASLATGGSGHRNAEQEEEEEEEEHGGPLSSPANTPSLPSGYNSDA